MLYCTLLTLLTIAGGKTPTDKSLRESQTPIVFEKHFNNSILKVYENGFTSYTAIDGKKAHTTVFSISQVNWSYYFADGTVVTIPKSEYEQFDAEIVLATYGEERLAHNNDIRQMVSDSKRKKLQTKYEIATPDISDDVISKLDAVARLQPALKELTDKQYQVVTLYYYEELTQDEIATLLCTTRSNVQSHLNNAIKKLKKLL